MRIDDICSPGLVPNNHRLRQETIRAIAFCENLKSSEKASELMRYFYEAIAYLDREIVSKDLPESEKPIVDSSAVSPFDDDVVEVPKSELALSHYQPVLSPKKVVGKPAVKGKK